MLSLARSSWAADLTWSVRTWQMDDGSNNSMSGIAQSPDGYLWIATLAGLNQFDGCISNIMSSVRFMTLPTPMSAACC